MLCKSLILKDLRRRGPQRKSLRRNDLGVKEKMVRLTGLEPVTERLEISCSIQLSYRRTYKLVGPEGFEPPTNEL
jgi:hypothetical protein